MKVLAVSANFDRCESSMLLSLANEGKIELSIFTEPNARYNEVFNDAKVSITKYEGNFHSRFDLKTLLKLRKILKDGNFDVVHLFSARAVSNGIIAAIGLSSKLVAYRGTMGHLSRFDPSSWLSFLNPRLNKIICVSHAVERYMAEVGVPKKRTITIHKGHRIEWYQSSNRTRKDIRKELSLPNDAVVVSCVANIRPVKGVDILLKAFSQTPKSKDLYLLLIGDIRDKRVESLIASSPNKERIITTGFRNDATDLIAASDIFTMPSIAREGLAKAAIEAMSKGVATIVTNVGGLPELVENNVSGIIIPPSDPTALAEAILRLTEDLTLRDRLAKAGPNRIEKDFNLAMTIEKTFGVYQELTGRN